MSALVVPDVSGLTAREAAHMYLDAGLMPHPWRVKGTGRERTKASAYSGFSFATIRETHESIDKWRAGWRCALVVSPASGLIAVDVDSVPEFEAWEFMEFPRTARSVTGRPEGGFHLLLDARRLPEPDWPRQGNIPGGQIKSNGFIAVEPSLHPNGTPYRWGNVREVAPAGKLGRALRDYRASNNGSGPGGVGRDHATLVRAAVEARPGEQHDSLRDYASDLVRMGLTESEGMALLERAAGGLRLEGRKWNERDLTALWRSAAEKTIPDARGPEARELAGLATWNPAGVSGAGGAAGGAGGGGALAAVPEYPVIDGPLGKLVLSSGHLPPALVGGSGLAALAAAASGWSLVMPDMSVQYPVLWVSLIAPRGAGKSPALDLAFETLRDLDAGSWRDFRRDLAEWSREKADERGPKPTDPSILLDDFTMEHLARALSGGDERACVVSDELSGWLRGLGRYGRGGGAAEVSRMLSLWSSSPWKFARVTGETSLLIGRPVVSVVGGIQPHLHGLLGDDETGMRPRWLPHYVPAWKAKWGTHRAPASWVNRITELYFGAGHTLHMDGAGLRAWEEQRERWHGLSSDHGASDTVHGALAKADVQCARIALVLAAAGGVDGDLPVWCVRAAAEIVDYVLGVWASLPSPEEFALSERDRVMREKVAKLLTAVEQRGGSMRRSDIQTAHVAGITSGADCDALIKAYAKVYPGCIRTVKTGGRPVQIVISPERFSEKNLLS